jgi:hypothetical protein
MTAAWPRLGRHSGSPATDLRAAQRSGQLVSVQRRSRGATPVDGIIVAVGLRWAVVRRFRPDGVPDDFAALPIAHASSVARWSPAAWGLQELTWVHRVCGEPRPPVDPTTATTFLRSVSVRFGVVTLFRARWGVITTHTGELERVLPRQVKLSATPLNRLGAPRALEIPIHEIALVEFGGQGASGAAGGSAARMDRPVGGITAAGR